MMSQNQKINWSRQWSSLESSFGTSANTLASGFAPRNVPKRPARQTLYITYFLFEILSAKKWLLLTMSCLLGTAPSNCQTMPNPWSIITPRNFPNALRRFRVWKRLQAIGPREEGGAEKRCPTVKLVIGGQNCFRLKASHLWVHLQRVTKWHRVSGIVLTNAIQCRNEVNTTQLQRW